MFLSNTEMHIELHSWMIRLDWIDVDQYENERRLHLVELYCLSTLTSLALYGTWNNISYY